MRINLFQITHDENLPLVQFKKLFQIALVNQFRTFLLLWASIYLCEVYPSKAQTIQNLKDFSNSCLRMNLPNSFYGENPLFDKEKRKLIMLSRESLFSAAETPIHALGFLLSQPNWSLGLMAQSDGYDLLRTYDFSIGIAKKWKPFSIALELHDRIALYQDLRSDKTVITFSTAIDTKTGKLNFGFAAPIREANLIHSIGFITYSIQKSNIGIFTKMNVSSSNGFEFVAGSRYLFGSENEFGIYANSTANPVSIRIRFKWRSVFISLAYEHYRMLGAAYQSTIGTSL